MVLVVVLPLERGLRWRCMKMVLYVDGILDVVVPLLRLLPAVAVVAAVAVLLRSLSSLLRKKRPWLWISGRRETEES